MIPVFTSFPASPSLGLCSPEPLLSHPFLEFCPLYLWDLHHSSAVLYHAFLPFCICADADGTNVRFYVAFNEIPEEFVSNSTVYFLRDATGMCPKELQPQCFQFCIDRFCIKQRFPSL